MTATGLLERWREAGLVGDGDLAFAALMGRMDPDGPAALAPAAALAFAARTRGGVCLDLRAPPGPRSGEESPAFPPDAAPDFAAWPAALRGSRLVGAPGDFRPLVLDEAGRLYLYRYWKMERELADDLLRRIAAEPAPPVDAARLRDGLARLFPEADEADQRLAAALAVLRPFAVISGGPGTGKTTTVVRLLALLVEQAGAAPPRFALAAPTGKAVARLQASVARAIETLPVDPAVRAALPHEARTLHRLLGARGGGRWRHDRENPLPADVVVVDEASMVDLPLMARLAAAVPAAARLILLGDRDQLASVEAGRVLGDLSGTAEGRYAPAAAARLEAVLEGAAVPREASAGPGARIEDHVALLTVPRRFDAGSGIARLASEIRRGDAEASWATLTGGTWADLAWRPGPALSGGGAFARELADRLRAALAAAATPEAAFAAVSALRVLCAHRAGPNGAAGINEAASRALHGAGAEPRGWAPGRPVLVTRNDYAVGLYNGDMGVAWPDADGELRAWFPRAEGGLRGLHPSRVPVHESAYAMTVHKSQGSEFEEVRIILPEPGSPLLTRELLYTAATRARRRLEVWCSPEAWAAAVRTRAARASGLRDRIAAG